MEEILLVGVAGFAAAFVDGSLGMGFGPTSSTLLLGAGLSPTAVSSTVNLSKVFTGLAGGLAHWRVGNVDRRIVARLAAPGCVGAVIGVVLVSSIDGDAIRPVLALLLLAVSIRILWKASRPLRPVTPRTGPGARDRVVPAAGLAGGVTNGLVGAWGPVVTPVVMGRPGVEPRVAVGSVNVAEVGVALTASGSLMASLGAGGIEVSVLLALLLGGTAAAPVAALAARRVPPRALAVGVGGLLALANVRELTGWVGIGDPRWIAYAMVLVLAGAAALRPRVARRLTPAGA